MVSKLSISAVCALCIVILLPAVSSGSEINLNASKLQAHVEMYPAVKEGSFIEGGTFEVPIVLNTKGQNINTVYLSIKFDSEKLSIVQPSGGTSIINLWFESPTYNNKRGTEKLGGIITNGIKTDSGLIVTLTFKAKSIGTAVVSISDDSKVLLNDGLGTESILDTVRGTYTIYPKPPGAVKIYSSTHPLQDHWYSNNNPVLSWDIDPGVTGWATILDTKPTSIPKNSVTDHDATAAFQNLSDGLWYFHIKSLKHGVWGETTHYQIKIDSTGPAQFSPAVNFIGTSDAQQALITFFTTDRFSGIDHYEVGVLDLKSSDSESPVFIQSTSPYQIPLTDNGDLRVIIRAFDKSGNTTDQEAIVRPPFFLSSFLKSHTDILLVALLLIICALTAFHYLLSHRIINNLKRIHRIIKKFKWN